MEKLFLCSFFGSPVISYMECIFPELAPFLRSQVIVRLRKFVWWLIFVAVSGLETVLLFQETGEKEGGFCSAWRSF